MILRPLMLSLVLAPSLALAQATPPPVTIGNEVNVQKPGVPEPKMPPMPDGRALRIGVVPSLGQGADRESERLAKYFTTALGLKVQPEIFANHDAEANAIVAGRIDFAWMPPLQAFNAQIGGAQLITKLVRGGATTYRSVFFVRNDSPLKTLDAVRGAKVGWVEANSATGHIFPLGMLAKAKLLPSALFSKESYLGNHDAVCKAVWKKQVDLGATLADEPGPSGKLEITGCKNSLKGEAAKLRVLAVSEAVPNDVIAVRKGLDPKVVTRLREVVLAMPQSTEGKAILKDSLKADGVAPLAENDFDPVARALEAAAEVEGK
jgi:phosphonate transport system substrate-binding protein